MDLKGRKEGAILDLKNVFFLPNSPSNLVSLGLLNNLGIFHNNEDEILYDKEIKTPLAYAQRWRNSFLLQPLNLSDSAVNLTHINNDIYKGPLIYQTTNTKLPLTTWHKRLGHLNFALLKQYLRQLDIEYSNDLPGHICDSCQRAKATKIYNRQKPQKRAKAPFQFTHTDLVGPISPVGFGGGKYFFTFTDDFTRYTETYTGVKKSDWFSCLKTFYNLCKTRSQKERPVERLRLDYGSELQSKRVEDWLLKEGIIFEPSAPYSQEQNDVSERMGGTIMDMTWATILKGSLDDDLWPEVIVAMTSIKNVRPTKALDEKNPYYVQYDNNPSIQHLRILGSTVYVFLHKKERALKSEKWKLRALRGILVGYDGHTIYRVYTREQNKVIRIKDLRIFEDYETKADTTLPDYQHTPTFQGFPLEDDNEDMPPDMMLPNNELNAVRFMCRIIRSCAGRQPHVLYHLQFR